jgi:hypothetical protein
MSTIYELELLPMWMVIAAALVIWGGLLWHATRLLFRVRERVICPISRRAAHVIFVRAPDGAKDDVERCSLLEDPTVITCAKQCLEAAAAPTPET